MKRFMATVAPGETKTELPGEISSISHVIIWALKRTLECPKCDVLLKAQAVELLLDLSVETSSIVSHEGSGKVFSCVLLHIYLLPSDYLFDSMRGSIHWAKKSSGFRRLAGERLLTLLPEQNDIVASDTNMFKAVRVAADNLIRLINGPDSPEPEFKECRTHAVTILRHLCRHYTKDDVYLREVIRVMTYVIPKVLKEIVSWLLTGDQIPAADLDLEQGAVSYGSGEPSADDIKLQEALIDLCMTIYNSRYINRSIYEDSTLSQSFDRICHEQGMPVQHFISRVKKARDKLQKEKPEQVV
ncbi:hypothetical protein BS78_08G091300 [Paspalum vaginatum]|nr:hypothetical protein BS78_08G091300 [Paspalum vaginatum]